MAHHVVNHRRHLLRVPDVRAILRLCNELHRTSPESDGRKRKLLDGVCQLTGADQASAAVASFVAKPRRPVMISVVHSGGRRPHGPRTPQAGGSDDGCACPWTLYRLQKRRPRGTVSASGVARRGRVVGPSADTCTTVLVAVGAEGAGGSGEAAARDHCAHSFLPLADGGVAACLTIRRAAGKPRFTQRERAMVCALHAEVAWVYHADVMLASPETRTLSPRERETLHHLLSGAGEKQIAKEMGLSYNTTHHYVKALYRHFKVSSRSELLARWVDGERSARDPRPEILRRPGP